ncbi:MAG: hypothetical protein COA88_00890 [Kordia sp.]|nr:MAG: hypothetical protein COA88_00890 [Kordia sp.]
MRLNFKIISLFITLLFIISCGSTQKIVPDKSATKEAAEITPDTISKPHTTPIIITEETNEGIKEETQAIENIEFFDHSIFNNLLSENISENGDTNYKGFIKNKSEFEIYLTNLSENLPKEDWSKEDKLAYWMNTYNAFTIKLIIDNYPTKSIKDIKNAWNSRFFKLGEKWYNLNDIEHKILRKMNDPRIHFGINCASFSCPPLLNRVFTAATVNNDLDYLAHQFINDPKRNVISENSIQISKIFQWFSKDFKTEGSLIDYLNKYSDITIKSNAKKSFKKYDWSLNEVHNEY